MLMKILQRLSKGGLYSNSSMAEELGVDESMIEDMIIQLQNMGYIIKDKMNSASSCDCCSDCIPSAKKSKNSCCDGKSNIEIGLWNITEKGKNTLKRVFK
jgi:hypothetical protein